MSGDPATVVTASGDRSIAIGGDAVYSLLVTGDNNTFFVGQYERLQDAYLDPQMLYRELGLDEFTGREWLVGRVDQFLARNARGYLVIEADAGMGKSTFLAWLARERGYVTHFVRLMRDPNDVGSAMRNLNAQLIRAWDLDTYAAGGILPPAADRPEFLQEVLAAAARQRDLLRPDEPIVLVIDGLNETTPVAGQNPLALPGRLPERVYVIVSQRTVHVPLRLEVRRQVVRIEAESVENQVDVREYLTARAATEPIAGRLRTARMDPAEFAGALLAKSQGVWIYLHYVLADIGEGRLRADQIDQLPTGLWHYYGQYWHDWQRSHGDRWHHLDLPVLSVIAAAAEPLPATAIAEFAGIADVTLAEELLDNDWRPFLQADDDDPVRYRPFHESLREFVRGSAPADDLTTAELSLARRLGNATRTAHARIADRFLTAWGGLAYGLPSLVAGQGADMDGGYGLRQVVGHLIGANRLDDVHTLLTLGRAEGTRPVNIWFAAHRQIGEIGAYERDIAAALAAVRSQDSPLRDALQLRYTLFACSLNSIAEATPPALWALLVTQGRQSPRAAIDHARRVPTAEDRAEALTNLITAVPARLREEVEREAIAAVRAVPDEFWRVGELWRLYPQVSPERRDALLAVVRSLADPYFQVVAYRMLGLTEAIPDMATPRSGHGHEQDLQSPSGMAAFASFVEDYRRRRQLAAARLNSADFLAAHRSARAAALGAVPIFDSVERYWTAHLLTVAALDAASDQAASLAAEAAEVGQDIGYRPEAIGAWLAVGAALAQSGPSRDWGLAHLVPRLDNLALRLALQLALAVPGDNGGDDQVLAVLAGHDDKVRILVLTEIAPAFAVRGVARATALIDTIGDRAARVRVLLAVADQAGPDAGQFAEAALSALEADPGLPGRAGLLARASRYLPSPAIRRALTLVTAWVDDDVRSSVLACLAVRLCDLDAVGEAVQVQAAVTGTWQADVRAALALAHLRQGDADAAFRLVPGIPSALRRAEILALAAHGPRGDDAAALVDEIVAGADQRSRVAILARACTAGSAGYRADRCARLVADAQAIEDYYDRSVALTSVTRVLVASGQLAQALDLCAQIPVEQLRGEALAEVCAAATPASIPAIADQAASMRDRLARTRVRMAVLEAADRLVVDPLGPLFDAALGDLAAGPRDQFLANLPTLLRMAARQDGGAVITAVASDLADAGQWWP